jgi:hypothetical protein
VLGVQPLFFRLGLANKGSHRYSSYTAFEARNKKQLHLTQGPCAEQERSHK